MRRKYGSVYEFTVVLGEIEPDIWRRIQVPESYSFWDLHVAIQDAMGWQDYHLHSFDVAVPRTGEQVRIGIPDEDFADEMPTLPGWDVSIADFFVEAGTRAPYLYDFGDSWEHTVTLERVLPRQERKRYPRCIAGERHCPPEDCGGVWGYEEFLQAIRDPEHEEHESMLEWVGGSFDPEAFDPRKVRFDSPRERWKIAFGRRRGLS
ncbi:MAG: plasmid pRiA4b ORF-3 family protein [Candidatus Methylomirabilia bacterium]